MYAPTLAGHWLRASVAGGERVPVIIVYCQHLLDFQARAGRLQAELQVQLWKSAQYTGHRAWESEGSD